MRRFFEILKRFARVFKLLKWPALVLLGIIGIFLVVNFVRVAMASARLNGKIAALRAAGEPTTLADLARKPIPPEQNAAIYLRRAREDASAIAKEVDSADEASSEEDQKAFEDGRPSPELLKTMRAALAAYPKVFPLIEEASNCPDYDPQFDFNVDAYSFLEPLTEQIQHCRTIFRVANYRVLVLLDEGQREEALETCLAMFRLARLLDHDPLLVSQLVCVAIRGVAVNDTNLVLQSGPLPPAAYADLDRELARFDMPERFRHSLRSERAFGLQAFHDLSSSGPTAPAMRLMPGFKNDMCDYLDMMAQYDQNAALANAEWNRLQDALESRQTGWLTGSVLPALNQAHHAMMRAEAECRTLRVLNALLARQQVGGAAEPTLADLGLPAEVTTDPFNGEPLHLKKLPTGWLVYSVGSDLTDGGGDLTERHDVGVGPPSAVPAKAEPVPAAESPAG